jgi:putative glutamine amidotransferase
MSHDGGAKPVIGINASVIGGGAGELPGVMLRTSYIDAVAAAGGIPMVLPALADESIIASHVSLCDGFVFVGGPDIDPARYGKTERHITSSELPARRENYDLTLIQKVIDAKKPFIAVCLGCQEVNVVLGGTLIQDIASETDSNVQHSQKHAPYFHRQKVNIDEGSLLSSLVGSGEVNANTAHHQAVETPGKGLKIVARCAEDNLIEALELENYPFGIAVQWHPEMLAAEDQHLNLFKGLVKAALDKTHQPQPRASNKSNQSNNSSKSNKTTSESNSARISLEAQTSDSVQTASDPPSESI